MVENPNCSDVERQVIAVKVLGTNQIARVARRQRAGGIVELRKGKRTAGLRNLFSSRTRGLSVRWLVQDGNGKYEESADSHCFKLLTAASDPVVRA
jgi:hypothetical protein